MDYDPAVRLKLMTYNLLYGSHEREGDALVFREERAAAAREVVLGEAPDILGLTEAVYVGGDGRLVRADFARRFALEHLYAAGFAGEWASCIVSRHPIVRTARLPFGTRDGSQPASALRVEIACDGRPLTVDVVHPSPNVREHERAAAMAMLLASAPRPYVLMGDFNSLSDEDPYDAAVLAAELRGNVPAPEALAARMLERQVIAAVRGHGLVDTMPPAARTHTLPTRLPRRATQGARLRIDYIFVSPELVVERAAVIQSAAAERASDHYPVVAEIAL